MLNETNSKLGAVRNALKRCLPTRQVAKHLDRLVAWVKNRKNILCVRGFTYRVHSKKKNIKLASIDSLRNRLIN